MDYYCKCPKCSKEIKIRELKLQICPICGNLVQPKKLISQKEYNNK